MILFSNVILYDYPYDPQTNFSCVRNVFELSTLKLFSANNADIRLLKQ